MVTIWVGVIRGELEGWMIRGKIKKYKFIDIKWLQEFKVQHRTYS